MTSPLSGSRCELATQFLMGYYTKSLLVHLLNDICFPKCKNQHLVCKDHLSPLNEQYLAAAIAMGCLSMLCFPKGLVGDT